MFIFSLLTNGVFSGAHLHFLPHPYFHVIFFGVSSPSQFASQVGSLQSTGVFASFFHTPVAFFFSLCIVVSHKLFLSLSYWCLLSFSASSSLSFCVILADQQRKKHMIVLSPNTPSWVFLFVSQGTEMDLYHSSFVDEDFILSEFCPRQRNKDGHS